MAEGTTLATWTNTGTGPLIATDAMTISGSSVVAEQVKLTLGDLTVFTGQMGGRNVDGSTTIAAGFIDPRPDGGTVLKTPTITATAYSNNQSLGGIIDFGAIARATGGGLLVTGITLADTAQQDSQIDLLLFNNNPTNGTYTDHGTITANATDTKMIQGYVPLNGYVNIGTTESVCSIPNVGIHVILAAGNQHLYGLMIVRATPTYGTTSALSLTLNYIAD